MISKTSAAPVLRRSINVGVVPALALSAVLGPALSISIAAQLHVAPF